MIRRQRKAFANWYLNEGMSEDQINALRASSQELIQSYQVAEESGAKAKVQDSPEIAARAMAREPSSGDSSGDRSPTVSLRDLVDKRRS